MVKLKTLLLFLFISVVCCSGICFAGIKLDRSYIEEVVPKGQDKTTVLKISNDGESAQDIKIELSSFNDGQKDIPFENWCKIEPVEIRIPQGEARDINLTIKCPEEAEGELRCRIHVYANEVTLIKNPTQVGMSYNIPLYVLVQGTVNVGAAINSLDVSYANDTISGKFEVDNRSNVHIRPFINFTVEKIGSGDKKDYEVPFGQVVPKSNVRTLAFSQKDVKLDQGKYKITIKADYGKLYGNEGFVAVFEKEFEVK